MTEAQRQLQALINFLPTARQIACTAAMTRNAATVCPPLPTNSGQQPASGPTQANRQRQATVAEVREEVRRAIRTVELPQAQLTIQPSGRTLVNLPTYFHTSADAVRRNMELLGQSITVQATPASYTWHHGDGTRQTSTDPGKPYPDGTITHTYQDAGDLRARLDITYSIEYRIGSSPWERLDETVTINGAPVPLRVLEARPALVAEN